MDTTKETLTCYHCGDLCEDEQINFDDRPFCCNGCKTVYQIFTENDLDQYYELQQTPGTTPTFITNKYNFLDKKDIVSRLLEFDDDKYQIITLYIPTVHCSSCIWVLENLNKLNSAVTHSQVNFPKKTIRITYRSSEISLKELVILLSSIGYEPYISLEDYAKGKKAIDRSLIYKLGVAGFAFGNIMFLSFPEYFEVNEFWLEQYKYVFRWLMFLFSIPVVFYSGWDYFRSAAKGLRAKLLNIDVPIALGIAVLFIRSASEVILDIGTGFFDSLTGLIFFLLVGKFFQQRTYSFLSFERDYKSYFPIAVTKIISEKGSNSNRYREETIQVYEIKKGDRLLIRNGELIPVDGVLINGDGHIDYSFVTGESEAVNKVSGDKLFAGGKQLMGVIEIEAIQTVEHSFLTQLWSNDAFKEDKALVFQNLTDRISKHFTITVLLIAMISTSYWLYHDPSLALNVFTAVLIIACPCAIALSSPFTLGNLLRIFGKRKFYLKNANVIERMAQITTVIFDKTGTISSNRSSDIEFFGEPISPEEEQWVYNVLRSSNHPLSRRLYDHFRDKKILNVDAFEEIIGKGIKAMVNEHDITIGSASFLGVDQAQMNYLTTVHVSIDDHYKGYYTFQNTYRSGIEKVFRRLNELLAIRILSGDNEGERERLTTLLPKKVELFFNQSPQQKLDHVKALQNEGEQVLMIGDGLNDAGALAQSDVGIVISENINVFTPACDGILSAEKFDVLPNYLNASRSAIRIIKWSFVFSFLYNVTGLYFAVTGQLMPVIAAILMPLSSISVVIFTTVTTNYIGRRIT
jgi:Cu+-exporting ATPase